jgi:dTDP-4-dehydrorhamnose reductase
MRLWIVGGNGMLGSILHERSKQLNLTSLATGRDQGDVTDLRALERVAETFQPTHIVNCAAYTNVDGAEKDPETAFAVNATGAENIACIAKHAGARLVHISTDYVFDGKGAKPYLETDPCAPINVYGKSKWEGEKKVCALLPQACVIRTSWLFGAQGKNFISSLLQWLKEKERIQVVSDQCGKPTYCGDLADAILAMLDSTGVYHFANSEPASRYEIALEIDRMARQKGINLKCCHIEPVNSSTFPTPAERPLYSVLSTEKITRRLEQSPRSWKEAVIDFCYSF